MKALSRRRMEIARGVSDMPLYKVLRLRARWEAEGYEVPPLERDEEEVKGLGDIVHIGLTVVGVSAKDDCGCSKRKEYLNRVVPLKKVDDAVLPTDDRRQED